MAARGRGLADAETDRERAVDARVGEEKRAAFVETIEQALVQRVDRRAVAGAGRPIAKAEQAQRRRRHDLEVVAARHLAGELPRQLDVLADASAQPLDAVAANHEPQLQRPEAAAERDSPVAVVDDTVVGGGLEVLGHDPEGTHQRAGIAHEVRRAVEVGGQPLVRVEHEAVDGLDAVDHPAVLGHDQGAAGPRRVDVQPDPVAPADLADRPQWIEARGAGGAERGDHAQGPSPRREVGADGLV